MIELVEVHESKPAFPANTLIKECESAIDRFRSGKITANEYEYTTGKPPKPHWFERFLMWLYK